MNILKKEEAVRYMNELGASGTPYLFIIDFDMERILVFPEGEWERHNILFSLPAFHGMQQRPGRKIYFSSTQPPEYESYRQSFEQVQREIKAGNTYLLNLTFPTRVVTDSTLEEIFHASHALYKLLIQNRFVVFSPEIFVRIQGGVISSFPMKGTIDAAIPNAKAIILNDPKETAEHFTIVDLIRNDLSLVAQKVAVKRFRYIDRISTSYKDLLQVSSEIAGVMPHDYKSRLGDIIFTLLPAGSVTGAPKRKTVEIIKNTEQYERGYYTGIFGYFDGNDLDSGVMIRFIEQDTSGQLIYKSGGGVTAFSDAEKEYHELTDKIYVPFG